MMVHFTLFRTSDGSLVVLPTEAFDRAVAEGQLTDAEADPICQGDIEDCLRAQIRAPHP